MMRYGHQVTTEPIASDTTGSTVTGKTKKSRMTPAAIRFDTVRRVYRAPRRPPPLNRHHPRSRYLGPLERGTHPNGNTRALPRGKVQLTTLSMGPRPPGFVRCYSWCHSQCYSRVILRRTA